MKSMYRSHRPRLWLATDQSNRNDHPWNTNRWLMMIWPNYQGTVRGINFNEMTANKK